MTEIVTPECKYTVEQEDRILIISEVEMIEDSIKIKAPDARLIFGFDWAAWLKDDEIITSGSLLISSSGITISGSYFTSASVIFIVSGGAAGNRYPITCRVATNGSQIDERTMKIDVKNR